MTNYIQQYCNPRFSCDREEAERLRESLKNDATYENGVARWKSNGSVIPADCADFAKFVGMPIDLEKTKEVRDTEAADFLRKYRESQRNRQPSDEELFEMRAAFGEGASVVNVITGRKTQL